MPNTRGQLLLKFLKGAGNVLGCFGPSSFSNVRRNNVQINAHEDSEWNTKDGQENQHTSALSKHNMQNMWAKFALLHRRTIFLKSSTVRQPIQGNLVFFTVFDTLLLGHFNTPVEHTPKPLPTGWDSFHSWLGGLLCCHFLGSSPKIHMNPWFVHVSKTKTPTNSHCNATSATTGRGPHTIQAICAVVDILKIRIACRSGLSDETYNT